MYSLLPFVSPGTHYNCVMTRSGEAYLKEMACNISQIYIAFSGVAPWKLRHQFCVVCFQSSEIERQRIPPHLAASVTFQKAVICYHVLRRTRSFISYQID